MPSGEIHKYRTHTCGELRGTHTGSPVRLSGWLRNRRDHGGVYFIDLADHYGITQLVVAPGTTFYDLLSSLPKETVIRVDGKVVARDAGTINPDMITGEIEVRVTDAELLGSTEPLPFNVFPEAAVPEDLRLTYRFLDLRKSKMHANILLRSKVIASIRRRMVDLGFVEYQTPTLTASSPEGARDFLVPSRRHPGKFYALPQAPQMFKQIIMVSGFDRYFQIAPCYRDEDARADRSPGEFYQLDLEMSFVTQDDVFTAVEDSAHRRVRRIPRRSVPSRPRRSRASPMTMRCCVTAPINRICAIPLVITRPERRFSQTSSFRAFAGKTVRAINMPQAQKNRARFWDKLEEQAKAAGAAGLAWLTVEADGSLKGPIAKFLYAGQYASN